MVATLSWLDVSAEQQRRVREIIRMFEEPGTRDELGIGPVRDAFSEQLFPGTSVIQTRARYFLFVPWAFKEAARRHHGPTLLQQVDRNERRLIEQFRDAGHVDGLIGRQAGARVKTLPSTIYWNGLSRLGVLATPMTPRAVAQLAGSAGDGEWDESELRCGGPWHPTLPDPPVGFPNKHSGGFALTRTEAEWLRERIVVRAEGTLLSHLVGGPTLVVADEPWLEPSALEADAHIRSLLEHARRFSLVVHGASLLYNLLVSEAYERMGFTQVADPVAVYRQALDEWAERITDERDQFWDWDAFWLAVTAGNTRVPPSTRSFIESWVEGITEHGPAKVAETASLRRMVEARVTRLRGGRAVLANEKLLALWGGSSGSDALDFRWGTVRRLILDVQEGLARAGS